MKLQGSALLIVAFVYLYTVDQFIFSS